MCDLIFDVFSWCVWSRDRNTVMNMTKSWLKTNKITNMEIRETLTYTST